MREPTPIALRKLLALRQFPLFATAELAEAAMVAENLVETSFAAGATVARPVARLPALHLITTGRIEMRPPRSTAESGLRIRTWTQRQAFGALEVLAGRPLASEAIAVVPTRTLRLAASDLGDILEDNFGLLTATIRDLATRIAASGLTATVPYLPPPGPEPVGLVERMIVLRSQVPFLSARLEALAILAHAAGELRWPDETALAQAGDPAREVFVVLDGGMRITAMGGASTTVGPGAVIGVVETLGGLRHPAAVSALAGTRAVLLPGTAIFDVFEDHPELGRAVVATFAAALLDAPGGSDPVVVSGSMFETRLIN